MGIWTAVFNVVQGSVIAPLVYGRAVSLHPAIVLIVIPAGGALAGILGMFLAVPLVGIIGAVWRNILAAIGEVPPPDPVPEPSRAGEGSADRDPGDGGAARQRDRMTGAATTADQGAVRLGSIGQEWRCQCSLQRSILPTRPAAPARDMAWIPGGTFRMGSVDFYPEERPVHDVTVDGFWMDDHPVTVAEFRRFVKATGHVTLAEQPPDPADYPDADPALLVPGSLVFHPNPRPGRPRRLLELVELGPRRPVAPPRGTGQHARRPRAPSRHSRLLRRRPGLCRVGRQGAPDRGRMGVRRPRRARRRHLRLGRRVRTEGPPDGEHLAGRVPVAEPAARQVRADLTGPVVPAERLRPVRRRRQRLGVDDRFLHAEAPRRGHPRLLRPERAEAEPAGDVAGARATTWAGPASRSRGWSSRAARTCAPRTTATATDLRPARRRPSRPRWATLAFAASSGPCRACQAIPSYGAGADSGSGEPEASAAAGLPRRPRAVTAGGSRQVRTVLVVGEGQGLAEGCFATPTRVART